ncbi:MAG TPA: ABC transporter substrate-binding protein [Solirubrobacteraceae bacterium]|jgi:peptide/nickel transport system substrate-binding protein
MTQERMDVGVEPDEQPRLDHGAGTTGFRAFVLSDIRGYSSFAAARGDEAAAALTGRFIAIAERVLGGFGGESIGNRGDEVLFAFESPRQAIRAAMAFEQALLEVTREDPSLPMPAGVGIDVGEAVVVPDGWRANAINVAARLCSIAAGGEVLATPEVTHLAQAIDGFRYLPRAATRVKGIAEPVSHVRVTADATDTVRGFAELGFSRAAVQPARRRGRRSLVPIAAVAALAVLSAIGAVLALGGSPSVRLAPGEIGVIATGNGQVTQALPVDAQPTSVAVGDGSIWVASATTGTLFRIDPRSHSVIPIPVGTDPVAVTVARDGSVWVANSGDGTVSRVSPENNRVVGSVRVEGGPSALVATSDAVWVANTLNASVSRIDLSSGRVGPPIPVGSEPAGIAAGGGSIWVANQGDGTVSRLDPRTGAQVAAPITVGGGPRSIAFGDGAAWVANSIDGTLSRIDAQTNSVETIHVGQGPYDVDVRSGHVWVSDEYANAVTEVDPAKLVVTRTIQTHSAPLGLALAGDRLWVATDGIGAIAHRGGALYALASGFNFTKGGDPPAIDPGSASSSQLYRVLAMTGDGLVGYRRQGGVAGNALVPDLAVALPAPTDNGLTYTFRIRSGIRYSTGVPLRASDFRRGLERSLRIGSGLGQFYTALVGGQQCLQHPKTCDLSRGVVADDAANTVTFHLTHPDPDLFDQLTLPPAYPVPPGTPVHLRGRSVPGTGPYQISSYSPDRSKNPRAHGRLILTRNRYFREWSAAAQPPGFPDQIVVRSNYSQTQQIDAVKAGRADLAWDPLPGGAEAALRRTFPSQVHENTLPVTTYLWLNVRTPPFSNLLARRAFNYAVDRGALARYVDPDGGVGRPTCQLLPPHFPAYVPYCPYTVDPALSGRWLAADVSRAHALVRESGTTGARVTFVNPSFAGRRFGQMLVTTLRAIGYRARLVEVPGSRYFSSDWARFQAGVDTWFQDYLAPSDFFQYLVECSAIATGFNPGGFCDHRLDARINKALATQVPNPGVASQEWTAIDRTLVDRAVNVPIRNELDADFVARRVGNYQYNPQWGVLVDQLWVR